MIRFIVSRRYGDHIDMQTKWDWSVKAFGQPALDSRTWNWSYYVHSYKQFHHDELITFNFYDEKLATWFKLRFPEAMTPEEFAVQMHTG